MGQAKLARMQHFAVEVSDTDRAISFYRECLGFKLTERHAAGEVEAIPVELTFMRLGDVHHELVLVHNPAKTYREKPTRPEDDLDGFPMFHHFAFECDSRDDWEAMLEKVKAYGAPIVRGPVLHSHADPRGDGSWGENEAFYLLDPDGHRIEIFCNLATIDPDGIHRNGEGVRMEGTVTEEL
ncbi:VOC family protein [Pseudahrensia aquimaris]|uniref:VOC family protein n=1 Tax=Pseudahrensia aquimaris TaxID=744461 RepID=A0ABW3FII3_9HYPH